MAREASVLEMPQAIEAERDALRKEIAALRAAWPTGSVDDPTPGIAYADEEGGWWIALVGDGLGPFGSRDAAIDAAAGLNQSCKTEGDST